MGYRLSMMAHFQNISFLEYLMFSGAVFLHATTVNDL